MTKRQLGLVFVLMGIAAIIALFAADIVGASNFGGVGPLHRLAMAGAILSILVGLSLLPLGDRPA